MPGLLDGKNILISGVITERSIAFAAARLAQEQGATVVLTGYGRLSLVERLARKLPEPAPVVELDVTDPEHLGSLVDRIGTNVKSLDGIVHSIAFAPQTCLGGNFLETSWDDVATAMHVSAYSYKSLAMACMPMLSPGGSVVGLTFDARRAWPQYDWMGVAKAALESTNRYLAVYLGRKGIRTNLVAAGPLRTIAARSIPGFEAFEASWTERSPLAWDIQDATPAAQAAVALLSDWFPATTGAVLPVDGGYHALG